MVRQAQNSKSAIGCLVDKISAVFVPVALIIVTITLLLWCNFGLEPKASFMLLATMSVLIIACPCALGLATPISIMVGVSKAAEYGVLIRNGDALQQAGKLTTIVLDKTGTVTLGHPVVTALLPVVGWDEHALLQIAASVEVASEYPLAQALLDAAKERGLALQGTQEFVAILGQGICARIINQDMTQSSVVLGNRKLMGAHSIDVSALLPRVEMLSVQAQTAMYLAVDGKLAGVVAVVAIQ